MKSASCRAQGFRARSPRNRGSIQLAAIAAAGLVASIVAIEHYSTQQVSASAPAARAAVPLISGPWGRLRVSHLELPLPADAAGDWRQCESATRVWIFPGYTYQRLEALLDSTDLTGMQRRQIILSARPYAQDAGLRVMVDDSLILEMSPAAREKLYGVLGQFRENGSFFDPGRRPADEVNDWLSDDRLSGKSIELVRRLLYRRGPCAAFSDLSTVLATVSDPGDKDRLLRMIARPRVARAKLQISPGEDIRPIVSYWSTRGRLPQSAAMLQDLADRGGGEIDVVDLLPPDVRRRMYHFPPAGSPPYDCAWTAMNFWNEKADDRYLNERNVRQDIVQNYVRVSGSPSFGDILVFLGGDVSFHFAVYIAGDIVYTKNGCTPRSAWTLMDLQRLKDFYQPLHPDMKVVTIRLKSLM